MGGMRKHISLFNKLRCTMNNPYLITKEEKLRSLIADEAKLLPMLNNMEATIRQMKAKQAFRLALLNQLLEEEYDKYSGN
jgi:predicted DNA binding protein